jgi:predicted small secreted protein
MPWVALRSRLLITAVRIVLVVLLSVVLSACMTMTRGSSQVIEIRSEPSDASVDIFPSGGHIIAPGGVSLRRKTPYTMEISKEGYRSVSIPIESKVSRGTWWRNLLWIHPIFWGAGVVIDISTGSGYELTPDTVSVTLKPLDPQLSQRE